MADDDVSRRTLLRQGALLTGLGVVGEGAAEGVGRTRATRTRNAVADETSGGQPMFQVDATNTGHNPDETGPSAPIARQWQFDTRGSVVSSPAVVDGTVYAGSIDHNIYALDAADGSELWRVRTGGPVYSSPAVVDETVYIGGDDGYVYALDATDGTVRWRFQTGDTVASSPAVVDGTLYVGSYAPSVHALDAATGTEQWRFSTGDWVASSPAVTDGSVYVGSNDGIVYALAATDGTEQWRFQTGDEVRSSPAVVDGSVYVGSNDRNVYALDAATGTEQWRFRMLGGTEVSPVVADGTVVVGSRDNTVYALDATDGDPQWRFQTGRTVGTSPTVADGRVYVGSRDGNLYVLALADGSRQWSLEPGRELRSAPVVVDGTVYFGGKNGDVYALTSRIEPRIRADQGLATRDTVVTLDGSDSEIRGDRPRTTRYEWAFGADAEFTATGQRVAWTFEEPGEHTVRLRVTADDGQRTTTATIPVADLRVSSSPETITPDTAIRFSSAESTVPVTDATYEWAFGADADFAATGRQVTTTFEAVGDYTVRLRVTTADGATVSTTRTVTVEHARTGPVWPQFRYDAANTGHPVRSTGSDGSSGDQWSFETGGWVQSSAAVVDGTVYVADDTTVYALDATTGSRRWRFDTGDDAVRSPAVVDGTVYVGTDGNLYAVDAASGTEQWRFDTDSYVVSSPAVVGGTVYVGCQDDSVYAVDAATGDQEWTFETGDEVRSAPAVADGTVYAGSTDGTVYALDAATGRQRWRYESGGRGWSSPAVVDGTVYVGSDDNAVYALDAASGTERWRFETGFDVDSSPAVADGTVYVGSQDDTVYALDAASGDQEWAFETGNYVDSSPAVVAGTVYVGSGDDTVYALDAASGDQEWAFETGHSVVSSPAVVDGTVYVGSQDRYVYALPADGPSLPFVVETTVERNLPLVAGAGTVGVSLAGLGAWRYRRGGAAAVSIDTDRGVDAWSLPGYDAAGSAAVPAAPGPVSDPGTAWHSLPDGDTVETRPAVTGGRTYAGTADGDLHAVETVSGDTEWLAPLDADDLTAPAVADGTVYVGTDEAVHARRTADGAELWVEPVETVGTLVVDGTVYAGTADGVAALRPATGARDWQAGLGDPVTALAVADDTVYAASEAAVTALDAASGDQQWQFETAGRDPRLAVGSSLVVSTTAGLGVHDPDTGEPVWTDDEGDRPTAVALAHGRVYQTTDTAVRALDGTTGTREWRTPLDATTGPVVVGDTVYVGTDGGLVAFDADDGDYLFTHDLDGVQSTPAIVGNAVFVRTDEGALTAIAGDLSDDPQLHAGTDDASASAVTDAHSGPGEPDAEHETETPPTTAAGRFARECEAIESATVVATDGPVHVYDGRFVDDRGQDDARIYALAPEHADAEQASAAFTTAAREWQGISKNTHIATVFDRGDDPRPWVAFDAGTARLDASLDGLGREARVDRLVDLAEAVRTGSMYNLVHGSITPETVFLTTDDRDDPIATLADWGLQRAVDGVVDEPPVTPYTAPEALDGETAGTQTDVYHLGAVTYRVLTGEPPFADATDRATAIATGEVTPPSERDPTLPAAVDDLVARAMAMDPSKRFSSPYDLRQRLLAAMD